MINMTLTLLIQFHEPWQGTWMTGTRKVWVKDEQDAEYTQNRYLGYFQNTYGSTATVSRLFLQE